MHIVKVYSNKMVVTVAVVDSIFMAPQVHKANLFLIDSL